MKKIFSTILAALIIGNSFVFAQMPDPDKVLGSVEKVNAYFMQKWPDPTKATFVRNKVRPSSLWTRAVYYEGLMALYEIQPRPEYFDYAYTWADFHKWEPRNGVGTRDADDYCCSQTYLDLYRMKGEEKMIAGARKNFDMIVASDKNSDWWWIDAIQMGMPGLAKMGAITGDQKYWDKMWQMYRHTRNVEGEHGMYNEKERLWWRDKDFDPPYVEPNGRNCYWSRGNGWVYAALVRVLSEIPDTEPHFLDYLNDYFCMSQAIEDCVREDGYWNVSMHDECNFGGKESSGTSLFVYGLAWGIRNGFLNRDRFLPLVVKAWNAMAKDCVHPDNGMLGFVQGTGKEPKDGQPVTYDNEPDFEDYGIGCFLLAGTEVYKLVQQLMSEAWPMPAQEAKPAARWWWMGSAVDKQNLTANMEEYARAGIGELEITPIYGVQGNDQNEIPFLSDRWMEMYAHTVSEGKRLGINIDMNTGTGWPFGGPDITTEYAAKKAVFEPTSDGGLQLAVKGTGQKVKRAAPGGEGLVLDHFDHDAVAHYFQKFDEAFERSGAPLPNNFFNDSYEVYGADWTPTLLDEFRKRRGYSLEDHFAEFTAAKPTDESRRILSDYRETLSDLLLENFTRHWTDWAHSHGSRTRNQAHGSPANLIDTYAAVDIPEIEGFGLSQFGIKGLRQDSLTRKNDSDFSMLKYASSAAHIAGKPLVSSETFTWLTEHFRTSLSQCKPDLDLMFCSGVNHVFFHGTTYSPTDAEWPGWKFYASIDMSPTNSIWRDAPAFFQYITRCQSFLQWGQPDNDFLVYLPVYDMWYDQPGRLLQFDIHHMAERAPRFIRAIDKIIASGYDVDYVSDRYLLSSRYDHGSILTEGGTSYRAIVVPGARFMPHQVLKHLLDMAKKGAKIVFLDQYPDDVPGFGNLENRRKQFCKTLSKIKSYAPVGQDYAALLGQCSVTPEAMRTEFGLHCIRRKNPLGHHYFIANLTQNDVDEWIPLPLFGGRCVIFDPLTGRCGEAQMRHQAGSGRVEVRLQLRSGESLILLVEKQMKIVLRGVVSDYNKLKYLPKWNYLSNGAQSVSLSGPWSLSFPESQPAVTDTFALSSPTSWTSLSHPLTSVNMGTGLYSTTFTLPETEADDWMLCLGDVRESARVRINGVDAGCLWSVPFNLRVGRYLKPGINMLEVEVTNLPANRIAQLDREGVQWRKFKEINVVDLNYKKTTYGHWQPMPSGLNSEVLLVPIKH